MIKAELITDKNYIIGQIDKRIYGSFIEHLGRAVYGGIYQPNSILSDKNGFRTDTADLVRELSIPVVRYPGGNFVSDYFWEDGIGDKSKRPTRLELAWTVTEDNSFGLDEFVDWAKTVNTEPFIAVNLGTKGIAEAKHIVEYSNHKSGTYYSDLRIKNGHEEPHNIKLWGLGNEMDGEWQIGHKTAHEYGRIATEAAKVMKWVDPSIELVACGSSSFGMSTFGSWETEVLDLCYNHVDYVSLHTYYGNGNDNTPEFLANTVGFSKYIESVTAICDYIQAKRRSKKRINLSFDEWNVWYHSHNEPHERWSKAPDQLSDGYNLEDALLVGGMLISLINHSDRVKIACLAQLVNVIAPIRTSDTSAWRQTIYYPLLHASKYGRGVAMNTIMKSPSYESRSFGEVPYVDAAIVKNENELVIFALNKHLSEPVEFTCDLRDFTDAKIDRHIILNGDTTATENSADNSALKLKNTESDPWTIVPKNGTEAVINSGILTVPLEKHSWNTIILKFNN
jgi:alpha-N-arabinofuranosidase